MQALWAMRGEERVGRWQLLPQGGGELALCRVEGELGDPDALLGKAAARADAGGWWTHLELPSEDLPRESLRRWGWTRRGPRIAWSHPIDRLPGEEGSPLRWRSSHRLQSELVHAVLEAAVEGDPLAPDRGGPADWLQAWQEAPGLVGGCQVGFLDGRALAFTGAQVDPRTGWGRIPYNGLRPEARGEGLGQWVLRRGFRLLRVRGAEHWNGGCALDNHPVRALLRRFGVRPGPVQEEWLRPPGGRQPRPGMRKPGSVC